MRNDAGRKRQPSMDAQPMHKRMVPDYSRNPKPKRIIITLTDANFEENIRKYPFFTVLFVDYMYLDFYDRIQEHILQLRWMARYYSGLVWFGVAEMDKNEIARDRYVGDVWEEEEMVVFLNGRPVFSAKGLDDMENWIVNLLPSEKKKILSARRRFSQPVIATQDNINSLLSNNPLVVLGFFAPGKSEDIKPFDRLAAHYRGKVVFAITMDRAFFNEKSRTFYRNPLFERFEVMNTPEVIIFHKGMKKRRGISPNQQEISYEIDALLEEVSG